MALLKRPIRSTNSLLIAQTLPRPGHVPPQLEIRFLALDPENNSRNMNDADVAETMDQVMKKLRQIKVTALTDPPPVQSPEERSQIFSVNFGKDANIEATVCGLMKGFVDFTDATEKEITPDSGISPVAPRIVPATFGVVLPDGGTATISLIYTPMSEPAQRARNAEFSVALSAVDADGAVRDCGNYLPAQEFFCDLIDALKQNGFTNQRPRGEMEPLLHPHLRPSSRDISEVFEFDLIFSSKPPYTHAELRANGEQITHNIVEAARDLQQIRISSAETKEGPGTQAGANTPGTTSQNAR